MSNFKINFGSKSKTLFEKKVKPEPITYVDGDVNIERDAKTELTELQKAFRQKAAKEKEMKEKNTSSEFWSCIIFQDQEQRDKFYELLGVNEKDNQYINGKKLIKALELRIETLEQRAPGKFKVNKDIANISIKPNF